MFIYVANWFLLGNWDDVGVLPRAWQPGLLERAVKTVGNWLANRSAFSLRSQPGTPSGPIALEEFKDNIFLKTDSSDTFKGHSSVIGRGKLSAVKGSKTFHCFNENRWSATLVLVIAV